MVVGFKQTETNYPAFCAVLTGGTVTIGLGAIDKLNFPTVVYDITNDYNELTTGTDPSAFTIPENGLYQFNLVASVKNNGNSSYDPNIFGFRHVAVNGGITYHSINDNWSRRVGTSDISPSFSIALPCLVGERVNAFSSGMTDAMILHAGYFSGHLAVPFN